MSENARGLPNLRPKLEARAPAGKDCLATASAAYCFAPRSAKGYQATGGLRLRTLINPGVVLRSPCPVRTLVPVHFISVRGEIPLRQAIVVRLRSLQIALSTASDHPHLFLSCASTSITQREAAQPQWLPRKTKPTMKPVDRNLSAAFAPSPPLSADASTSDCEIDAHTVESPGVGHRSRPQRQTRRHAVFNSSPASFRSSASAGGAPSSAPSTSSSFTSEFNQEETLAKQTRGRPACTGGDLDRAYLLIEAFAQGLLPDDLPSPEWHVLHLTPPEYLELLRRVKGSRLGEGYKFRHDYNPETSVLVLRMGGNSTHEYLQQKIFDEIKYQLRNHTRAADPVLSDLLGDIEDRGQMGVVLEAQSEEDIFGIKCPDAQLWAWHEGVSSPQFLMEVGYSQKNEELPSLARQYYEGSNSIKTVLTIKVPYYPPEKRKTSSTSHDRDNRPAFSLYRGPDRIYCDQPFRNDDGSPTGVSLQLFLADFIPDPALENLDPQLRAQLQATIDLPAQMLCQFLGKAERAQADEDIQKAEWKKRKREWETRKREGGGSLPTGKRKSVKWDVAVQTEPKRQRTNRPRDDNAYHDQDSSTSALPERRRTRSASRSEQLERRRTRSMSRGEA